MRHKIVLFTYANPLRDDNNGRLMRIAQTLSESKFFTQAYILCVHEKGQPKNEKLFKNVFVKRFHFRLNGKKSFFVKTINNFLWLAKIILWSLFKKIEVVNFVGVLDLITIPYFRIIKKSNICYYADDIATENRTGGVLEKIFAFVEKTFLKHCDRVIVVSDGIKSWYEEKYGIDNVHVIWNAPILPKEVDNFDERYNVRKLFHLKDKDILFGYVGTFTTGRSLEQLLGVFEKFTNEKHLVLAGYGELERSIKKSADKYSNIHYIGAVPWDKILSFVSGIDVGLVLLENVSLNYYYALPTKLFQYLGSGKSVLVSDFPDMAKTVKDFNVGWTVKEKEVVEFIEKFDTKDLNIKKIQVCKNRGEFLWPKQSKKLFKIYESLIG